MIQTQKNDMDSSDNIQKDKIHQISQMQTTNIARQQLIYQIFQQHEKTKSQGYSIIVTFISLGFYFLIFAIVQLSTNYDQVSYEFQLTKNGKQYISPVQFVSFNKKDQVSIYLQIKKLTQFDIGLLSSKYQMIDCGNYRSNQQVNKKINLLNGTLNPKEQAIPCGQYMSYYPEGIFQIFDIEVNVQTGSVKKLQINTNDLASAFSYHGLDQLKNIDLSKQWANLQTERYKHWKQSNTQLRVKKLWGRIQQIVSGSYQVKLTLNNEIQNLDKIHVSLNNNKALGGYNKQLCYINFFYAILVFIAALASFLIQKKYGGKNNLKKKQNHALSRQKQNKIFLNSGSDTPAYKLS